MVAILNPDILPDVRMTIEEYLSADLPEGHRYELVGGVVMMSPIPDPAHDLVVAALNAHFVLYCARRPGIVEHISQRCGVTIPTRRTVREPDLGVYSPDASPGRSGRTWRNATPMLVVEVISPGQEDRDYADKRRDYWDAGVSEYWIADPVRKTLTVLTRNRGAKGDILLFVASCQELFVYLDSSASSRIDFTVRRSSSTSAAGARRDRPSTMAS